MSKITERLYALESAQHPRDRTGMRWRMSQDVADSIGAIDGFQSPLFGRFMVMGYPVVIDHTLPPDSLLVEQMTASEQMGPGGTRHPSA